MPGALRRAAIVAVGNELLFGETVDTNSAWIGRTLAEWGVPVVARLTVADDAEAIGDALGRAMEQGELVVVSGGLGPTADDVTKAAVATRLGLGLVVDEDVRRDVEARFAAVGFADTPRLSLGQSEILEGSIALPNTEGTAPGILVEVESTLVVLVPGPPAEMRSVFSGPLRDELVRRGLAERRIRHRLIHTTGIRETILAERLDPVWRTASGDLKRRVGVAYLPDELGVDVRMTTSATDQDAAEAVLDRAEAVIAPVVEPFRFDAESGDLAEALGRALVDMDLKVATAESCTGGLIAKRMTDLPGASLFFTGGVTAYDNAVKTRLLGVPPETLRRYGAVSEEVAALMAEGAARALAADCAISTTGVAGPGGGSPEKPVGTVCIGVWYEGRASSFSGRFAGDRGAVRRRSAQAAMASLYRRLTGRNADPDSSARP